MKESSTLSLSNDKTATGTREASVLENATNLYHASRFQEALHLLVEHLNTRPRDIECLILAGACCFYMNDTAGAERVWLRALEVDPRSAATYNNLGIVYTVMSRLNESEAHYRKALSLAPDYESARRDLIVVLRHSRQLQEAERFAREGTVIDGNNARAFNQLGLALQDLNKLDEAKQAFDRAIEIDPARSEYAVNLGHLLLSQNRWAEGFELCERRHAQDLNEANGAAPRVPFAQWQGQSLKGKSLLIWPEQGFGKQIQLVRFMQKLRGRGAKKITLVCFTAQLPLFASLSGVDSVVTPDMYYAYGAPAHDFWVFNLSIPYFLRASPESIPVAIPYLKAPKKGVAKWQPLVRVNAGIRKIGLVWQGSPHNARNATRSLPGLATLEPLWRVERTAFYSLQHQTTDADLKAQIDSRPIASLGDKIANFADLAAVIMNLDLVITVDTAVAHLAGALGKPTWILLPNVARNWRWGLEGSDSVWYPGVARLFRQAVSERDWTPVIERVADALSTWQRTFASETENARL